VIYYNPPDTHLQYALAGILTALDKFLGEVDSTSATSAELAAITTLQQARDAALLLSQTP
jgi:hypothetical protein